jgi:hypothetical protein
MPPLSTPGSSCDRLEARRAAVDARPSASFRPISNSPAIGLLINFHLALLRLDTALRES